MRRLALGLAFIAQLTIAPAAFASQDATSGFVGSWVTTDCLVAAEEPHLPQTDCGDVSVMVLRIGQGDTPRVIFRDTYASSCDEADSPSTRWVASGSGTYVLDNELLFLVPTYSKSGCGTFGAGGYEATALYHDPGSDTLWDDSGGDPAFGYVWYRTS